MLPFFIEINLKYPTFNQYIGAERGNKYYASKLKKQYTRDSKMFFIGKRIKEYPIQIRFIWFTKTTARDIDGWSFAKKCILDGMVQSGFITDDRVKYVNKTIDEVKISKKDGVMIFINRSE